MKNDDDKEVSRRIREVMPVYMQAKYDADKNLVQRTAFKWTILRPGGLSNKPATGKAKVGKARLKYTISVSSKFQHPFWLF